MKRSAVILAESAETKTGDLGICDLEGKPLIAHVVDVVSGLADEVVVVTRSQKQADEYAKLVSSDVKFVVDSSESDSALSGAATGFEVAEGDYTVLLGFNTPIVSQEVLSLLFDCSAGKAAVIPRYTTQEIEPLQAVYQTKQALEAAREALAESEVDLEVMVERLRGVRYMSMMVIEQLDPELKTYFCVRTPVDLKKAAIMLKPKRSTKKRISGKKR